MIQNHYFCIVAEVITDVPQRNITEGGDSLVCVALNVTSIRDIIVVLSSTEISATGEFSCDTDNFHFYLSRV